MYSPTVLLLYLPSFEYIDCVGSIHGALNTRNCCIFSGLKGFYGKKARLKNEIIKRHHEKYVEAEDKRQVNQL